MKAKKTKRSDVASRAAAKKRKGRTVDLPKVIAETAINAKTDPKHAHLDSLMQGDVQPIKPASPVEVLCLDDLSDADLSAITKSEIPKEHRYHSDDIGPDGKIRRRKKPIAEDPGSS